MSVERNPPPPTPLGEAARHVAHRLTHAGHQAFFAGGCVRDTLLGIPPEDFDIATSATPSEVQRIFPHARGVGEAFGVMLVRSGGHVFEVATFRTDVDYVDGRRPTSVRFSTAQEDAERRDFSINGLFQDPESGEIIDFVGGRADLDRRILRSIGDPARRFSEDHLRLLRAVRFAARFHLAIEPATALAMRADAGRLASIARERIGGELRRMLAAPTRATATSLLEEYHLDGIVLGEPARRSVGQRTAHLDPDAAFECALAAWGFDRQGEGAGPDLTPETIARWRQALVLSNDEVGLLGEIARCRRGIYGFPAAALCTRKRLAARRGFSWAWALVRIEHPSLAAEVSTWRDGIDPAAMAPPPLVTGHRLIELGLAPGPAFRELLERVYDEQLEGRVQTVEEGLAMVRRLTT